ncbi:outer membrane receptor proteins, mostly Fe transport [Microbacterium testaceum StLB037]|uniref:Outer membrane receptor proteins, mostly Fe transport n=1 Tax=Microbacterium testaceum (strain StLB037) TaxID=979556 RepID=E8NGN4_MICTS|nr:outer membrane receptor proteins, mostly Fe transport [Microbacterium testaceum StLB037]
MLIPGVLALLLALSGCVYAQDAAEQSEPAPTAFSTQDGTDSAVSAEPTDAPVDEAGGAPTDAPVDDPGIPGAPIAVPDEDTSGPSDMLTAIRLTVVELGGDVGAEQVASAADYTCDQLAAGVDRGSIVALQGDIPAGANETLVQLAADEYCPIR